LKKKGRTCKNSPVSHLRRRRRQRNLEKIRSADLQIQRRREADPKTRKKKFKINCHLWCFLGFAGDGVLTGSRKVKMGGRHYSTPHAVWISRRRVGRRAAIVPPVPEGFLTLFWDVLGYLVIFTVFNVIFV
jgi:hypothetical protein